MEECVFGMRHIFKDSKNLWVRAVTHAGKKLHRNAFWLERENNLGIT